MSRYAIQHPSGRFLEERIDWVHTYFTSNPDKVRLFQTKEDAKSFLNTQRRKVRDHVNHYRGLGNAQESVRSWTPSLNRLEAAKVVKVQLKLEVI